ncbi:MAG: AraC family transcriptional regulator [Eubacteriales bacterium]|nr:AraC family transcriptional regulator [Eubacteriales bacterium]
MEEQIKAVQRMQDYIEAHLYENMTIADLATASMYSPWYAYRLFTQRLNITPSEYIRRLRLSKSALRLRDERVRIMDVAFDVGFVSVDGYQRAFFREFGCNPREYARAPIPLRLFVPYGIQSAKMRKETTMKEVKNIFIQFVEKPARKVLIKRGINAKDYYAYCEEVGCDIWGLLLSMKSISGKPVGLWLPPKIVKPGTSTYVQGVEVPTDYNGSIPDGLDVIELPQAKYLMFQGEPFAEEDYEAAIEQVWDAIKKHDPSVIGYSWDADNPRIQLEPRGERGYIELMAIK